METINQQLRISVPTNPNISSRYARGLMTIQPQLGNEDWSLDFYNDTANLQSYTNMNGWDNVEGNRDLSNELYENDYSEFLGMYPICVSRVCKMCKSQCKGKGLKWMKGGKQCHTSCVGKGLQTKHDSKYGELPPIPTVGGAGLTPSSPSLPEEKKGMGTGAMIGVVVGGLALIGLAGYLILKK